MNKFLKILVIFLAIDIVVIGAYFGLKSLRSGSGPGLDPAEEFEWVVIDEYYQPPTSLMEFIKGDAVKNGLLPIEIRNYGQDAGMLKKFRGSKFVGPKVTIVEMSYKGLEDWALADFKTKNEQGQELNRAVLYILLEGKWIVGDSGRFVK